jgi:CheY-like chemotaxis protein
MYPAEKRILVIDSNALRRQQAACILGDEGFAVSAVADGFSALHAARQEYFALAVVAVEELTGVLDGVTTLRHLRSHQPWLKALFTGSAAARKVMASAGVSAARICCW